MPFKDLIEFTPTQQITVQSASQLAHYATRNSRFLPKMREELSDCVWSKPAEKLWKTTVEVLENQRILEEPNNKNEKQFSKKLKIWSRFCSKNTNTIAELEEKIVPLLLSQDAESNQQGLNLLHDYGSASFCYLLTFEQDALALKWTFQDNKIPLIFGMVQVLIEKESSLLRLYQKNLFDRMILDCVTKVSPKARQYSPTVREQVNWVSQKMVKVRYPNAGFLLGRFKQNNAYGVGIGNSIWMLDIIHYNAGGEEIKSATIGLPFGQDKSPNSKSLPKIHTARERLSAVRAAGLDRWDDWFQKLTGTFSMGQYLVTQSLWHDTMGTRLHSDGGNAPISATPSSMSAPVIVSWLDCIRFCNKLSKTNGLRPVYSSKYSEDGYQIGIAESYFDLPREEYYNAEDIVWDLSCNGYRLPTAAELEYASIVQKQGVMSATGFVDIREFTVGQNQPNRFKLYDVGLQWPSGCQWSQELRTNSSCGNRLDDLEDPQPTGPFRLCRTLTE